MAPWRSSGYGKLAELFFASPIKSSSSGNRRGRQMTKSCIARKAVAAPMFCQWQFWWIEPAKLLHTATRWLTRICARELGWFAVLHMDRVTTQTSLLQGVKPADVIRP
jgi:hypothetical protein